MRSRSTSASVRPSTYFHDDEGQAVGFAVVVNRDDVGMSERAGGANFLAESRVQVLIVDVQDLDGDRAADLWIVGTVHRSHRAGADALEDLISADRVREGHS